MRSITNAGINSVSLGFAIIAVLASSAISLYAVSNSEWALLAFASLGFLFAGKVYLQHRRTQRLEGSVEDQVYGDLLKDPALAHRPLIQDELRRRRFVSRVLIWGPVAVAFTALLVWGLIPIFKTILVYIPPVLRKLTGTM